MALVALTRQLRAAVVHLVRENARLKDELAVMEEAHREMLHARQRQFIYTSPGQ